MGNANTSYYESKIIVDNPLTVIQDENDYIFVSNNICNFIVSIEYHKIITHMITGSIGCYKSLVTITDFITNDVIEYSSVITDMNLNFETKFNGSMFYFNQVPKGKKSIKLKVNVAKNHTKSQLCKSRSDPAWIVCNYCKNVSYILAGNTRCNRVKNGVEIYYNDKLVDTVVHDGIIGMAILDSYLCTFSTKELRLTEII